MFLVDHNKTAIIHRDVPISYRELLSHIAAFAAAYRIKKGDRVVLCSENRPEWIYAFYSIWRNRGIVVPIDAASSEEEISRILKDSTPATAICSAECAEKIRSASSALRRRIRIVSLDSLPPGTAESDFTVSEENPDDTAMIMYTSGTTGKPKGVILSFENLAASIQGVASLGMLTREDSLIGLLPFHHIFPLQGTVIAPLCIGSTVVMVTSLSSEDILAALQKHKITIFLGVPKLYELFHAGIVRKINESPAARLIFKLMKAIGSVRLGALVFKRIHRSFGGHVHSYLTGGAPMDERVAHDLWSLGFPIVEGYGLTETAPLVAFNPKGRIRLGTVGVPLSGTEVKIEDGEILVRGRNVTKGYYRDPEATARKIRDGWFHTGDLGRLDNGYLYVMGRIDEMIVLPSGKNIHPDEIEERILAASPYIREAGVFLHRGHLTAAVVPNFDAFEKDGVGSIIETIRWKVIDRYNADVQPHKRILGLIISRKELPRTRLGKLKRYLLQEFTDDERNGERAVREPDTPEYTVLKKFLQSLSQMEAGPDHHLELDLGLDSLNRVELLVFIESAFGITLDERDLALNPTLARLAEFIGRKRTRVSDSTVEWREILQESVSIPKPSGINLLKIISAVAKPLFKLYFRLHYRGMEHLPESPFILSPNHQSFIDVVLIAIALPRRVLHDTFFIARDSLAKSAAVRYLMRHANVIFINFEHNIKSAMQVSASILKSGKNLVIFPEGHRTRNGKLAPFKKTFAILSTELSIPVVPVAISGAYEALPTASIMPRPGKIELTFCKPVRTGGSDYHALTERIRSIIRKTVEAAGMKVEDKGHR